MMIGLILVLHLVCSVDSPPRDILYEEQLEDHLQTFYIMMVASRVDDPSDHDVDFVDTDYCDENLYNGDDPSNHNHQVGKLPVVSKAAWMNKEGLEDQLQENKNYLICSTNTLLKLKFKI